MSRSLELHWNNASTRRMKRGGRRATSRPLFERPQHARDGAGQAQPAVELGLRRAASLPCQRVELGIAVVLGGTPFGLDQALFFHAIERRIERSLFHVQRIIGQLMQPRRDAVAVIWSG